MWDEGTGIHQGGSGPFGTPALQAAVLGSQCQLCFSFLPPSTGALTELSAAAGNQALNQPKEKLSVPVPLPFK